MLPTLTLLAVLHAAPAADTLPGTWQIKGDVSGNPVDMVCTIRQSGSALTGDCGGNLLTGEAKEGRFTFQHGGIEYEGEALTLVYSGTLAEPREMRGTITVLPFDVSGSFTAKPAAAPASSEAPRQ
jgi:hypothetical protein